MDMTQSSNPDEKLEDNPIKNNLWNIDSVSRDGQVKAPPEDDGQRKFLKNTTWTQ